jgi:hypothetical protein
MFSAMKPSRRGHGRQLILPDARWNFACHCSIIVFDTLVYRKYSYITSASTQSVLCLPESPSSSMFHLRNRSVGQYYKCHQCETVLQKEEIHATNPCATDSIAAYICFHVREEMAHRRHAKIMCKLDAAYGMYRIQVENYITYISLPDPIFVKVKFCIPYPF